MSGNCSNPDCVPSIICHVGCDDKQNCTYWQGNKEAKNPAKPTGGKATLKSSVSWEGNPLKTEQLALLSFRNFPIIVGIVGKADAGKTTFLAMLYTLLLRGEKFQGYNFAGSKTILGWDELYHKLKVQQSQVAFPDPTPVEYLRLHHLALKSFDGRLNDLFLADASGEVFSWWSQNRDDIRADNSRWVYRFANAFILFIDCEDLINRKNKAKTEIVDIAQMLLHDLGERPVIAVWSKADKKDLVHANIRQTLSQELGEMFVNFKEIDISNFSKDDPDALVHENNLKVIDWLMDELTQPSKIVFELPVIHTTDPFLNYKG